MQIKRRLIAVNFVTPQINSWFFFFFFNLSFDSPSMNQSFHHQHKRTTSYCVQLRVRSRMVRDVVLTLVSGTTGGAREVLTQRVIGGVVTWLHLLILALEDGEYPEAWITRANLEPRHISLWYTLQTQWVHRSSSWHMAALIQLLAGCPT